MAAHRRTGSSHGVGATGQPRQLPGSACEECRKRKLRCDRQRPQCGTCADAGIVCEINNNRLARGPKKGDLKALRSRIGTSDDPHICPSELFDLQISTHAAVTTEDHIRGRLDARRPLYFDRVHPNVPIFNQSRYFARVRQNPCIEGPTSMLCLQYAMWTLAMALSSQFESSRELLYNETRQMLEALDLADDDLQPVRIEQVQAWLLVSFYELARASYRRALISAGRAFRLVQLARLHEVDGPGNSVEEEDPVVREERRRTFWMAYSLDRLICMRSRCPLTLTEEVICTRLPSPELAFQSGHPIPGCFLPEALASGDHNFISPFAGSVMVISICGRALSHGQASGVERAFGTASLDFWLRHEWLDGMLGRTLESLTMNSPVASAMADPMVFFAFMMAHATTIFMCQIAEASGIDSHCRPTVADCQGRATQAAREIARMAKAHEHIGYFKLMQSPRG
ncbi:hypothetical protein CHGG_05152 [Chaetomium globosum CBS 148.51]|uniref:Zn(2)-C6 fungal-type domain-containing protein n=1 Tax=Chaetomium globosum (strain ATCC 6205 / CBS 148.51 / DSM 1962 / NBRC 6347 / NRRL 1970) TaxID=306901 RepID=Q2GZ94_CHAGB|nr:uncharacterized protein CHGG_05152 [Chaetomium globosum CBS 148.51]EAQ88533.1 hypothetical protein CHGG_05152 [Chaetomium globosum CBS 148.51]